MIYIIDDPPPLPLSYDMYLLTHTIVPTHIRPPGGNSGGVGSPTASNSKGGSSRKSLLRRKGSKLGVHMTSMSGHVKRNSVGSPRNELTSTLRHINHHNNNRLVLMRFSWNVPF